jgi:hypothetical protein
MRPYTVLQLRVDFTVHVEDVVSGRVGVIYKALGTWAKAGMHGKATMTFLVVTRETSSELQRRMEPAFEQMGCVDNHWCHVAPEVAVARRGQDPFVHYLGAAWQKAREWNKSENMRNPQVLRGVAKGKVDYG